MLRYLSPALAKTVTIILPLLSSLLAICSTAGGKEEQIVSR